MSLANSIKTTSENELSRDSSILGTPKNRRKRRSQGPGSKSFREDCSDCSFGDRTPDNIKLNLFKRRQIDRIEQVNKDLADKIRDRQRMVQEFSIFSQIKHDLTEIIDQFNKQQAQDTIKEMEYHELCENKKDKEKEMAEMEKELNKWIDSLNMNRMLENDEKRRDQAKNTMSDYTRINEQVYNKEDEDEVEQQKAEKERQMFDWVL